MYVPVEQMHPQSRAWIYQANRSFSPNEENIISNTLNEFCSQWSAHGNPLQTSFKIEHSRFIILLVDESSAGASGCSIDGSVRILKQLGDQHKIDFFDRTEIAFLVNEKIQVYPIKQLKSLFENSQLGASSQTFNNLVTTKAEWQQSWKSSVEKSWLVKYLPIGFLSV